MEGSQWSVPGGLFVNGGRDASAKRLEHPYATAIALWMSVWLG